MFHDITCSLLHSLVRKIFQFMKITVFCDVIMRNLIDITDVSEASAALSSKQESKSGGKYWWIIQARRNKQWESESAIGSCFVNGKALEIKERVRGEKRILKGRGKEGSSEVEGRMYKVREEARRYQLASPFTRSLIHLQQQWYWCW
jgi:hypothetical protein